TSAPPHDVLSDCLPRTPPAIRIALAKPANIESAEQGEGGNGREMRADRRDACADRDHQRAVDARGDDHQRARLRAWGRLQRSDLLRHRRGPSSPGPTPAGAAHV